MNYQTKMLHRKHYLQLFLFTFILTGCAMDALKNEPTFVPTSYTTMDDLFIPDPPFSYQVPFEDYRFEPIVFKFNHIDNNDFEEDTYIYIKPYVSSKIKQLDDVAAFWQVRINRESNSLISIQKKGPVRIGGTNAYELIYHVNGFDHDQNKKSRYIERVYFIPVNDNQVASIRMIRNIENDNQTTGFWKDWIRFLKSIKIGTPSPQSSTVAGKTPNTRHYFVRNLNFDIPLGDADTLNIWSIRQNAERTDSWNSKSGKIRVTYHISDGYDDTQKSQNDLFKENAQGWGNQGGEIIAALLSSTSADFEYHEVPFGLENTIYGFSTIKKMTTEMTFNVSYKHGKSIEIELDGDSKTMADNKDFILEWLGQFRVIK